MLLSSCVGFFSLRLNSNETFGIVISKLFGLYLFLFYFYLKENTLYLKTRKY